MNKRYLKPSFFAFAHNTKTGKVVDILIDYQTSEELVTFISQFKHSTRVDVIMHHPRSFGKRAKNKLIVRYWVDYSMWE